MDNIKAIIETILPKLPTEKINAVIATLDELGVVEQEDLKYVEEKDLSHILKPIPTRKLLKAWNEEAPSRPVLHQARVSSSEAATSSTTTVIPFENQPSTSQQSLLLNLSEIISGPTVIHIPSQSSTHQQPLQPNWADVFSVPWHKMPYELMSALNEGRRPKPSCRRNMVRIICNEIHRVCSKPGKKNLSVIARKVVAKYPASLADTFCGEDTLGDGSASLLRQLELRFENMNRGSTYNVMKRNLKAQQSGNVESSQAKKLRISDQYGCVNWQPTTLPFHETEKTQAEKKQEMKVLSMICPKLLDSNAISLLNDTYYSQRKDINSGCEIRHLLNEWPLLFKKEGLLNHFLTLVGIDIVEKLTTAFSSKGSRIVGYMESKPRILRQNKLQETLEELKEEGLLEISATTGVNPVVVILIIMAYFGDSPESLFMCVNISLTASDIEQLPDLPSSPCLIVRGKKLYAGISYMLCIDRKVVNDELTSFEDGLAMLFAAFYCFNIEYPTPAATTLEFIQRCFLNINPDRGSKVNVLQRKKYTYNRKILTLLNGVTDFEWSFQ